MFRPAENSNENLANNAKTQSFFPKGRKTTKPQIFSAFKKPEVMLINVKDRKQAMHLKAVSRWYMNKSSFYFKNPHAIVLRFMTQVPLYFRFSHIPGSKTVSPVCKLQ